MLPSNITSYRQLCANLHSFFSERYYQDQYLYPSRADNYLGNQSPIVVQGSQGQGQGSTGLMDYWVNKHLHLMVEDFRGTLPRVVWPIIKNVVSSKAVAFREMVQISLVEEATGRTLTEAEVPLVATLNRRLTETGWFRAMREKEDYTVLFKTAASHYKIVDGELIVTALAPYAFQIDPWAADPGDNSRARYIAVPMGGMQYVADPEKEARYLYERIPGNPPQFRAVIVDGDGVPMQELPEAPGGNMIPQLHPVVIWKDGESAGPFCAPPLSLYNAQVDLNLELISATVAVRTGGHGTVALEKQNPAGGDIPGFANMAGGRNPIKDIDGKSTTDTENIAFPGTSNSILRVPDGWTAQLLQSRVDPAKYAEWITTKVKAAYLFEELSAGTVDITGTPPSNVSGQARLQENMPRLLSKSRREARLKEQATADLKVWAAYWNLLAPASEQVPEGVGFRIKFSELWSPTALTDMATMQALDNAAKNGLVDLVEMRQQIDGSTYEEAKANFWQGAGVYKRLQTPLPVATVEQP